MIQGRNRAGMLRHEGDIHRFPIQVQLQEMMRALAEVRCEVRKLQDSIPSISSMLESLKPAGGRDGSTDAEYLQDDQECPMIEFDDELVRDHPGPPFEPGDGCQSPICNGSAPVCKRSRMAFPSASDNEHIESGCHRFVGRDQSIPLCAGDQAVHLTQQFHTESSNKKRSSLESTITASLDDHRHGDSDDQLRDTKASGKKRRR